MKKSTAPAIDITPITLSLSSSENIYESQPPKELPDNIIFLFVALVVGPEEAQKDSAPATNV